jgi:serine/threonine protein kinase
MYESCWKGIKIVIKVLKWNGSHNEGAKKSFTSDVRTLGLTQHINLVRLLGYCIEGLSHMLVYEYMSNKSLDQWLFNDDRLNWNKRTSIIIGVAQGLAYLHHKCNPSIVHLDIKPGNILLDKDYTPKLADFGLAKILNVTNESVVCALSFFLFD